MKMTVFAAAMTAALCAWSSPVVKDGEKVAFLGDSITQFGNVNAGGYVNLVMDGLRRAGVKNLVKIPAGVSGHKSNQMLARLQRDVLDKKPDWMLLSCGVNDVGHGKNGVELEPYKKNISEILDRCEAAGVKVVILTPTLCSDAGDWQNNPKNVKLEGYCEFLREQAAKRGLPIADLNAMMRTALLSPDRPRAGFTMDNLHMNGYGNQLMAKGALKALGLTDAEIAKCVDIWTRQTPAMLTLGIHWANWNDTRKQITISEWEMLEHRAQLKGKNTFDYILEKVRNRKPDVDWRRFQYETEPLKLAEEPAAGFHGRVAALERIDGGNAAGDGSSRTVKMSAWRNERVNAQIVLWTKDPVEQVRVKVSELKSAGETIPASASGARFVRYTGASFMHWNEGGPYTKYVGDILDDAKRLSMTTNSFRPVWLTVKVPAEAKSGIYRGKVDVVAAGGVKLEFPLELDVLSRKLPEPSKWKYFLDLWQHPWAVSRYHGVEPFSREHYALMRPLWEELAQAGQKTITTTITDLPWNHQNFDAYHSMVRHIRKADGTFKRDFTLWDEYVEFCESCGLGPQIHCYTMATWGHIVYWEDETTGDVVKAKLVPGTPEHEKFWGPFLTEFRDHVKSSGRLGRVYIALDERSREELMATAKLIRKCAPELKLEMAGNKKPSEFAGITVDNYCQYVCYITDEYLDEVHKMRPSGRFTSTYYICCGPKRPNTFSDSPLHESVWCGLYPAAKRIDGLLRWAYVNWTRDPFADTTHGLWRPADCYLVYPGCRVSSRWEMLRDGIEEAEKIRILRDEGKAGGRLEKALSAIDWKRADGESDDALAADVREVLEAVKAASR